jgi:hypothetical protein
MHERTLDVGVRENVRLGENRIGVVSQQRKASVAMRMRRRDE